MKTTQQTKPTTPAMLRRAIKKEKLPIGIAKAGGDWYIFADSTVPVFFTHALTTYRLDGTPVVTWIEYFKTIISTKGL